MATVRGEGDLPIDHRAPSRADEVEATSMHRWTKVLTFGCVRSLVLTRGVRAV